MFCSVLFFHLVFKLCYILNGFIEPLILIRILIKFFVSVDTASTHLGLVLLGACLPLCTRDFASK